ncbi:hypothetical protein EVAR_46915_1 [Eumeta japonica]|uniref:Uncharacterized protein n=1 Tax=Eumeta variegata TaxID=151549 RepID=A0A4C1Y2G1_EUMVA|nr:hypothetical protein EVAR_46915_1 [Eumeta japonica]
MYATHATDAPPIKCSGVVHPTQLLANRHLVKLGLIKSERKRCPLLTTPPHCKKSADHRKKRAHREERQSGQNRIRCLHQKAPKGFVSTEPTFLTTEPPSLVYSRLEEQHNIANETYFRNEFSPCERDGEGGEKPLMGRPCARAHRCVRLAQTKNLLNNVNLQWREQNAITPSFKKRPYGMEMPSARDCPMGALRVTPRHRRSRETYSTDCKFRGDSGGAGSAPD